MDGLPYSVFWHADYAGWSVGGGVDLNQCEGCVLAPGSTQIMAKRLSKNLRDADLRVWALCVAVEVLVAVALGLSPVMMVMTRPRPMRSMSR